MSDDLNFSGNKGFRLLRIHQRLNKGEILNKVQLARDYHVVEKTIQRDIDDLRSYLAETNAPGNEESIQYDKSRNGYFLARFEREWLTNQELLVLLKVLLESRALCKEDLDLLIDKLLTQVTPADYKQVADMVRSERFHYVAPRHNKPLISAIWDLSKFIVAHEIIEITYTRKDGVSRTHTIKPVSVLFSEYYFYLVAFMADGSKDYPTIFRIDRIIQYKGFGGKFHTPYKEQFNDGEFRKRVQFMYSGELQKIKFRYSGPSIEAVLDRLPTAEILSQEDGAYILQVEVYGTGIEMWLRSQGEYVNRLD